MLNRNFKFLILIFCLFLLVGCSNIIKEPPGNVYDCIGCDNEIGFYSPYSYVEDLSFTAGVVNVRGVSNNPDWEIFLNDTYLYWFSPTTMEQAFITVKEPHNRKIDSNFYPVFFWTTKTAGVGNVVFCFDMVYANTGEKFNNSKHKCVHQEVGYMYKNEMTPHSIIINGTKIRPDTIANIRIYRDATHINDTFPEDVGIFEFNIHYIVNKLGTKNHLE